MKNPMIKILFMSLLFVSFMACKGTENKPEDSKEVAEQANKPITDNTDLDSDIKFVINTAEKGIMEVQIAQLAISRSKNAQIIDLSKMLEADHTALNNELTKTAASKNITIPQAMSDKSAEQFKDLNAKMGADFDKEYLKILVDNHESSIDAFKKEAENGNDLEIKAWASTKIAALQAHYDKAKALYDLM